MEDKLYQKAYEHYTDENYDEALRLMNECRKKLRKKSYLYKTDKSILEQEISLGIFEGKINMQLGNIDDAESLYTELRDKIVRLEKTSKTRGKLSYYLSDIAEARDNIDEQLNWLRTSKDEFVESGNYNLAVDIMFDVANVEEFNGQTSLINHYKEIIELSKHIEDDEEARLNSARARLEIGYLLRNSNPRVASRFLILAHKEFDKLGKPQLQYRALTQLADLKSITKIDRAIEILEKALSDMEPDEEFTHIFKLKLITYHLKKREYEVASQFYDDVKDKLDTESRSIYLANAMLGTAKSYLLMHDSDESFNRAANLAKLSNDIYDHNDLKIGKAIGYLIQGIADFIQHKQSSDNSKLKLVHFLARKLEDKPTFKVDEWVREMVGYLATSDVDSEEIIGKISLSDDIPTLTQNAEILHLLGLYKLSNTEMETARHYLDHSKSLYHKTGNYTKIETRIDNQLVDLVG